MYKIFLTIGILAIAGIAVINMLATGYYFGANARAVIGGLFIIPAILGVGGKFVKILAYLYTADLMLSIAVYFIATADLNVNFSDPNFYYFLFRSFFGCVVLSHLLNIGSIHNQSEALEKIEPRF